MRAFRHAQVWLRNTSDQNQTLHARPHNKRAFAHAPTHAGSFLMRQPTKCVTSSFDVVGTFHFLMLLCRASVVCLLFDWFFSISIFSTRLYPGLALTRASARGSFSSSVSAERGDVSDVDDYGVLSWCRHLYSPGGVIFLLLLPLLRRRRLRIKVEIFLPEKVFVFVLFPFRQH